VRENLKRTKKREKKSKGEMGGEERRIERGEKR